MTPARPTLQPRLEPITVGRLRLGVVYVTPSARLCRLAPPQGGKPLSSGQTYVFEYVDVKRRERDPFDSTRFELSAQGVGLLREVRR